MTTTNEQPKRKFTRDELEAEGVQIWRDHWNPDWLWITGMNIMVSRAEISRCKTTSDQNETDGDTLLSTDEAVAALRGLGYEVEDGEVEQHKAAKPAQADPQPVIVGRKGIDDITKGLTRSLTDSLARSMSRGDASMIAAKVAALAEHIARRILAEIDEK